MKIAYYSTVPPPQIPGTESVDNQIRLLIDHFGGEYIHLYPFKWSYPRFPWQMIGLHRIREIKKMDRTVDIHHIFSSGFYPYPVFHLVNKPVIYSVVAGIIPGKNQIQWPKFTVVVESERDLKIAEKIGLKKCRFIRSGIDYSKIKKSPLQIKDELTLLSASAPWTKHQLYEKGLELLLEATSRKNNLCLVVLMRGLLADVIKERLKFFEIEDRVTIIDMYVDINTLFSQTHGTIVISSNPAAVRSYPHSLIESLAAGKPVILSDTIPMADYVRDNNLGCVVADHSLGSLETTIDQFICGYNIYRKNAEINAGIDFSLDRMVGDYIQLYNDVYFENNL